VNNRHLPAFFRLFLPVALLILFDLTRHDSWGEGIVAGILLIIFGFGVHRLLRSIARQRETEQRFRAVFDHAMVGMASTSPEKGWLSVNPALCQLLGYSADVLMQKTWAELTHPDDLTADLVYFEAVLRGESDGYSMEKRFIRQDGAVVHTFIAIRAVRKRDGSVDFFSAIVQDITERLLAEQAREASAQTLQRFIDHLPGIAYVKDAESHVLLANRGFFKRFGMDPKAMLGQRSQELFPGAFGEKMAADEARIIASGKTEIIEELVGEYYFESTKFVIPRDNGPADLGGITLDITQRHLAEQNLAKQIRRAEVLLELPKKADEFSENAFMQFALERAEELTESVIGFIHFVNDDGVSIELVAWSRSTLENYCAAAFDTHYPIAEAGIWADAAREKWPVVINDYATASNKRGLPAGHSVLNRLLSVPVIQGGAVHMITGVGNKSSLYTPYDIETVQLIGNETWRIVRRQRTEIALRLATQVVNASPVICFRWGASAGWPVIFVSENVAQWGYTPENLVAQRPAFSELVHPDDLARIAGEMEGNSVGDVSNFEQEYRLLTADHRVIWVVDRTVVRRDAEGKPIFYDGVLTDITERKCQQLVLADTLLQQQTLNKRLEEANNQLLQSEKMASIGQLAAGIAHEMNNPIGFVHSNLGTLDGYLHDLMDIINAYEKVVGLPADEAGPPTSSVRRLMEERDFDFLKSDIFNLLAESKEGLGRVRKIVQDLKSFSHAGKQDWQEVDLHPGLDSTLNIVWNELKYKCKVVKVYGDIPPICCLVSQLNQVFMNLLVNAGQSIEKQGTITIRTRRHGDDAVCVEISDTGKGIAPEHLNRIFEPFFTTKPVGKGTGLGLSLSYSIVERHGGRIEVESLPGQGSTFRVVLPIHPIIAPNGSHEQPIPETAS
jgi:PAS domain S-box-containing protein